MIIADKIGRRSIVVGSVDTGFACCFSPKAAFYSAARSLTELRR